MAYKPSFVVSRAEFILHNASPDPIVLQWAGIRFIVPPANQVDTVNGAHDRDGDLIPGTAVVKDGYGPDKDGGFPSSGPYNWMASEAIKHVLGIEDSGDAISPYAAKGLSFVPANATKEQIREIVEDGLLRYHQHMVDWANYEISAFQQATERASRAGLMAPPPGKDYGKAISILKRYNDMMAQQLTGAAPPQAAPAPEPVAEKSKEEQALDLMNDPAVRKLLKAEGYRIRKVGHLEDADIQE